MKYKFMKENKNGQQVVTENDVIEGWLNGAILDNIIVNDMDPINIYNAWADTYDITPLQAGEEYEKDDYIEQCMSNWSMPVEYTNINIVEKLLTMTDNEEQYQRVALELELYFERGMEPVLRFLIYLVDLCRQENIVLGVGRGSSVASYCLYLIGIHRIDSIKYNLDIKEFLK